MKAAKATLLFLMLYLCSITHARQIRMNVDWALFDFDEANVYLEIYYSFLQSDLTFFKDGDIYSGQTMGRFQLFSDETLFKEFIWKNQSAIQDTSELRLNKDIIDKVAFSIPSGTYQCKFCIYDIKDAASADSFSWNLDAFAPNKDKTYLSEIQLARSIKYSPNDNSSPFYKNQLIVQPNPSLIFSSENPVLFFYIEAYNLPLLGLDNGYQLKYYVRDAGQNIVKDVMPKTVLKKQVVNPSVEFGMLNVGKLASGTYNFEVELIRPDGEKIVNKEKRFYVFQAKDLLAAQKTGSGSALEESMFSHADSTDIELEFLLINYLLSKEEKDLHKQIQNLGEKRRYLFNFWKNRYPSDKVSNNQFRNEFLKRYQYANEKFRAFRLDGWRTDRGRVYMVYGPPSDIERYPNEPNLYPYEIWYYNDLQNGVKFVFADLEGHNNYQLLHSDLDGELRDYDYVSRIQRGF
jgi:GWxTD domain-containing protein